MSFINVFSEAWCDRKKTDSRFINYNTYEKVPFCIIPQELSLDQNTIYARDPVLPSPRGIRRNRTHVRQRRLTFWLRDILPLSDFFAGSAKNSPSTPVFKRGPRPASCCSFWRKACNGPLCLRMAVAACLFWLIPVAHSFVSTYHN